MGKKSVLLLHGFGASRWEMQTLENYLLEKEYDVHNTRIAGHETSIEDFAETTWKQWYSSAQEAYNTIKNGKKYAIGFSMGGTLAMLLAQNYNLDALVTINSPVWLRDRRAKLAGMAKHFLKAIEINVSEEERGHRYERRPISAVAQLNELLAHYKKELHKIKTPTLIVQSTKDPTIEPKSAQYLYEHMRPEDKQLLWYDSNEHAVTRNHERTLFPAILNFLESH